MLSITEMEPLTEMEPMEPAAKRSKKTSPSSAACVTTAPPESPGPMMMGTTFLGPKPEGGAPAGPDAPEGSKTLAWLPRPVPRIINSTDIVGRVHKTTICGTDLHILGGNVPKARKGLGLGHEGIIDILEVGSDVKKFKKGDRVLCCCISNCGACSFCEKQEYGNCTDPEGSWSLGHTIDGFQSQFVRVPHADRTCYSLPAKVARNSAEENKYLLLADILPTSYEVGLIDGDMADGKTVAVVGAGPVGLSAILVASAMYKPAAIIALDLNAERLQLARDMGATHTIQIPSGSGGADTRTLDPADSASYDFIREQLPSFHGVDLVVEAVGLPSAWYVAQEIVRAGGNIAILGVHGKPVTLNLERMWYRNFKLTAGMVHGHTIKKLMKRLEEADESSDLTSAVNNLITHTWKLSQIEEAYELFGSRRDGALKMLLINEGPEEMPSQGEL